MSQDFQLEPPDDETQALLQSINSTPSLAPASEQHIRFYYRQKKNPEKSKAEGRAIYESAEYVEILTPGDKDTVVDRPVRNLDKYVWQRRYEAFKRDAQQESGTPLAVWGVLDPSRIEELAYFRVKTVEQLASVSDGNLQKMGMHARAERDQAKAFIAAMKEGAPVAELKAENDALKARLEALEKLAAQSAPQAEHKKATK